ncbi:MAG TPA: rhodanese-like domain-containing protein [Anaerolineaceae bacterium]|nr:rhodanese-like domain-containing protein [Anaerolineaceae bacterium]
MAKRAVAKPAVKTSRWVWLALVLAGLAVAALIFATMQGATKQEVLAREISVAQAAELRDQGVFILDVRTREEWNQFHVPDSTLIPLDELPGRVSELPKDQPIVVVCRSGNRSQSGRDILVEAGFTEVSSMTGGLTEWQRLGYPTVTGP